MVTVLNDELYPTNYARRASGWEARNGLYVEVPWYIGYPYLIIMVIYDTFTRWLCEHYRVI